MKHPTTYLLEKIVFSDKNGLETLGRLNAEHIDNLSEVMRTFTYEAIEEVIERVNRGEVVYVGDKKVFLSQKKLESKKNNSQPTLF